MVKTAYRRPSIGWRPASSAFLNMLLKSVTILWIILRACPLTEYNKIVRYLSDQEHTTLKNARKASDWNSHHPYSVFLTCSNKHSQREATSILTQGAMHRDFLWYFIPVLTTMPAMDKEYQCCVWMAGVMPDMPNFEMKYNSNATISIALSFISNIICTNKIFQGMENNVCIISNTTR